MLYEGNTVSISLIATLLNANNTEPYFLIHMTSEMRGKVICSNSFYIFLFYRVKIEGTIATMIAGTLTIVGTEVGVTPVEAMTVEIEEMTVIIADVITDDDEKRFAIWRNLC